MQGVVVRMTRILYGASAFAVVAGVVMIGFGAPVNEFSFGNMLIGSGVVAIAGGFVVFGLAAVVAELKHLSEALAVRGPIHPGHPMGTLEAVADARPGPAPTPISARVPFPPRPRAESPMREAPIAEPHAEEVEEEAATPADIPSRSTPLPSAIAPMLRNPEEAPLVEEEDVSLSPPHPTTASSQAPTVPPPPPPPVRGDSESNKKPYEPKFDWRSSPANAPSPPPPPPPPRPQQSTYFDAMWSGDPKPASSAPAAPVAGAKVEPTPNLPPPLRRPDLEPPPLSGASEPRVAVLKSGVVDGMGYTLYVDGSIEAELPQGTLRFSSINELRSHLEKNT